MTSSNSKNFANTGDIVCIEDRLREEAKKTLEDMRRSYEAVVSVERTMASKNLEIAKSMNSNLSLFKELAEKGDSRAQAVLEKTIAIQETLSDNLPAKTANEKILLALGEFLKGERFRITQFVEMSGANGEFFYQSTNAQIVRTEGEAQDQSLWIPTRWLKKAE